MIVIATFNNLDIAIKGRTVIRYMVDGATKILNHVVLQICIAGLKTALREELYGVNEVKAKGAERDPPQ
jgi:hypothetical protein